MTPYDIGMAFSWALYIGNQGIIETLISDELANFMEYHFVFGTTGIRKNLKKFYTNGFPKKDFCSVCRNFRERYNSRLCLQDLNVIHGKNKKEDDATPLTHE